MISPEKRIILTPLQKLPKNVRDLGILIVAKGCPKCKKIAQSGHTTQWIHLCLRCLAWIPRTPYRLFIVKILYCICHSVEKSPKTNKKRPGLAHDFEKDEFTDEQLKAYDFRRGPVLLRNFVWIYVLIIFKLSGWLKILKSHSPVDSSAPTILP